MSTTSGRAASRSSASSTEAAAAVDAMLIGLIGLIGAAPREARPAHAYRAAARARAFSASTSRSFGGAVVTSSSSRCRVMCAISCTARSKAAWLAADGFGGPADLADVLQRGGRDLVAGRRRLEVVERADVAAHASESTAVERGSRTTPSPVTSTHPAVGQRHQPDLVDLGAVLDRDHPVRPSGPSPSVSTETSRCAPPAPRRPRSARCASPGSQVNCRGSAPPRRRCRARSATTSMRRGRGQVGDVEEGGLRAAAMPPGGRPGRCPSSRWLAERVEVLARSRGSSACPAAARTRRVARGRRRTAGRPGGRSPRSPGRRTTAPSGSPRRPRARRPGRPRPARSPSSLEGHAPS